MLLLVLGSVERNDAAATGPSVKPEAKVRSLLIDYSVENAVSSSLITLFPRSVEIFCLPFYCCISLCPEFYWQLVT